MKKQIRIVSALGIMIHTLAFGQGGTVGGGGTGFRLSDDTVIVADSFIPENAVLDGKKGQRIGLSPELKVELTRAQNLMEKFSGFAQRAERNLLFTDIFSASTEYRLVNSLEGVICDFSFLPVDTTSEPNAVEKIAYGCTRGKYTYLVETYWNKMNLREKAKAIIHERIRSTPLNNEDTILTLLRDVSRGLDVGLRQYDRESKSQYINLTPEEVVTLETMATTIVKNQLFFKCTPKPAQRELCKKILWSKIHSGGGVIDNNTVVGENVYLGIAVSIYGLSTMDCVSDSSGIDCFGKNAFKPKYVSRVGSGSIIAPSDETEFYSLKMGERSSLKGLVHLNGHSFSFLSLGDQSHVENLFLDASFIAGVKAGYRVVGSNQLIVGDRVSIKDVALSINNRGSFFQQVTEILPDSKLVSSSFNLTVGMPLYFLVAEKVRISGEFDHENITQKSNGKRLFVSMDKASKR